MSSFKSFADLSAHLREQEAAQNREDVRKAQNLLRSSHLRANRKRGTGPAVAR